jgi:hypothetical protein
LSFFVIAVVCHGRLAATRPPAERLTGFYLWVAVGGVLGGTLNALVAPVVFDSLAEYPLIIVAAAILRSLPWRSSTRRSRALDAAVPAGVAAVVLGASVAAHLADISNEHLRVALVGGVPILVCGLFLRQPLRLGLALAAVFLTSTMLVSAQQQVLHANRTFFGIQRVEVDPDARLHLLSHGTTIHGAQSLEPSRREEPLSYYSRSGPLGQIVEAYRDADSASRVAVIGLGTGSMACYAESGESWTFYELDPEMERIARDPRLFTFLRDCGSEERVVLGDARLSLARASGERYGLIAVDAFSSDAIPVHLITREALQLYLQRLAADGILAFHISNGYVDLHPVLADLAADLGLVAAARDDNDVPADQARMGRFPSHWVALAPDARALERLLQDSRWYRLESDGSRPVWTDDYSNLLSVFHWK